MLHDAYKIIYHSDFLKEKKLIENNDDLSYFLFNLKKINQKIFKGKMNCYFDVFKNPEILRILEVEQELKNQYYKLNYSNVKFKELTFINLNY